MKDISIIIPSYNTKDITFHCLESLYESLKDADLKYEIITVDNASSDGSVDFFKIYEKNHKDFIFIQNRENVGFAKANNIALKTAAGRYILFLNSDVIIKNADFGKLIKYLDNHADIGVLTVKVTLPQGGIDPASHRGFPTIWNSFCYYSKLEKIFGKMFYLGKLFGSYHLTSYDLDSVHEIDSPTGAFYLTRKEILDRIKGFDEEFFMYGEDLDLSFRIKKLGFKIIYYPLFEVTHLKYSSGLNIENQKINKKIRNHFYEAMKIFYNKHYKSKYPGLLNKLVYTLIDIRKKL